MLWLELLLFWWNYFDCFITVYFNMSEVFRFMELSMVIEKHFILQKRKKCVHFDVRLIIYSSLLSPEMVFQALRFKLDGMVWTSLSPLLPRCAFNRKPMSSHFLSMFSNEVVDLHWMFQDCRKWFEGYSIVGVLPLCLHQSQAALQGWEILFVLEVVSFRRDVKTNV